jgi:hypothetical protein
VLLRRLHQRAHSTEERAAFGLDVEAQEYHRQVVAYVTLQDIRLQLLQHHGCVAGRGGPVQGMCGVDWHSDLLAVVDTIEERAVDNLIRQDFTV